MDPMTAPPKVERLYQTCLRVEDYANRCRAAYWQGRICKEGDERWAVHPELAEAAARVARKRLALAVHELCQPVTLGGYTLVPEPGGQLSFIPNDRLERKGA